MLANPLSRVLPFALAGAVLAGAIALKQRASSRALLNAEPNASITHSFAREIHGCKSVTGHVADHPACMKTWRKNQERFIGIGNSPGERAATLPPDRSIVRSSLRPKDPGGATPREDKASRLVSVAVAKRRGKAD